MKLRGKIFGSFEPTEFELKDVTGFHRGCIMIDNDTLQASIIYNSIRLANKEVMIRERNLLLEMTALLGEHPTGYEGPCLCQTCQEYF